MLKFSADCIYTVSGPSINNGIVVTNDTGKIMDVLSPDHLEYKGAQDGAKYFSGAICPGFVNTHCHLELSFLKGHIPAKTGLNGFIQALQKTRTTFSHEQITNAIQEAELQMLQNGIVAVGDICNGSNTLLQKQKSKLYYHSFIELFGFDGSRAVSFFSTGIALLEQFENAGLSASLTPHAPYSTSFELMELIADACRNKGSLLSIHNQESEEENKLFQNKSGKMADMLKLFGLDISTLKEYGKNSLPVYLSHLNTETAILLVHNTFSTQSDIEFAQNKNVFWCLCPNANLYIENCLPNIPLLIQSKAQLTLGTDSLASNTQLSIWEEIKTIQQQYPEISLELLLEWGTLNGANYLGIQEQYGSLEKGKKPGLVLLENLHSEHSNSTRII